MPHVGDLFPVTLAEQIACIERELRMRRSVYQRLTLSRRMSGDRAATEIAQMEAVLKTLKGIVEQAYGLTEEDR